MCEKIFSKRAKFFFVHVRLFKAVFFIFWLRGFVMILF